MKVLRVVFGIILFCFGLGIIAASSIRSGEQAAEARTHAYHDYPSTEPLPETLDPAQFASYRVALVVYRLAAQIKQTLFQVPCYCPCDRRQGHTSLLDCYRDRHGVACPTCQKELLFCFREHQKGKTPAQIRNAIARGKAWKIDIPKSTERIYSQLPSAQR
jgi:Protein of unknown function with PCYCGC motif